MEMTKINKIILSAVAVMVLLALYVAFDRGAKEEVLPLDNLENTEGTATTTETTIVTTPSGVEYTIEKVDTNTDNTPKPVPDLNRAVVKSQYAVGLPDADADRVVGKIKELQTFLKTNPTAVGAWIDLGAYQKTAGDYDGAIISWEYASKLAPLSFVSLGNIGNLYGFYIKDVAMADVYYRKAISRAPGESYLYAQLAEVYQYTGKNIGLAKAVLNEGLKAIPNDPNLEFYLSELE